MAYIPIYRPITSITSRMGVVPIITVITAGTTLEDRRGIVGKGKCEIQRSQKI
jgi:hypothetical protein